MFGIYWVYINFVANVTDLTKARDINPRLLFARELMQKLKKDIIAQTLEKQACEEGRISAPLCSVMRSLTKIK